MDAWGQLDGELAAWAAAGTRPTMWWRDDDAVDDTGALRRLMELAGEHAVPLALAVIPAPASEALAGLLDGRPDVLVLQHGLAHANHAPAGEKKAEFGPHRPVADMLGDAAIGREALAARFGARALPVFVPPWNRIDERLLPFLTHARLSGLSRYRARAAAEPAPGLREANCHADPVDWHGGRGFVGEAAVLGELTGHLRARRTGAADADEPTGLLTHHLAMDRQTRDFLARLLGRLGGRDGAHWLTAAEVFSLAT